MLFAYDLLNFIKLSTLLIKNCSHKQYTELTALVALAVVCALWSFKILKLMSSQKSKKLVLTD